MSFRLFLRCVINARKRLYQIAIPRIYGGEFYRTGFGKAVNKGILTDYKVMILVIKEEAVARRFERIWQIKRNLNLMM